MIFVVSSICFTINFATSEEATNSADEEYPFVYVYPSLVEADVNDTFTIAVVVENLRDEMAYDPDTGKEDIPLGNLYGFDIQLGWNPSVIQYVNHTVTVPYEDYDSPIPPRNFTGVLHKPPNPIMIKDVVDETGLENATEGTLYWVVYASIHEAEPYNGNGTFFTMTFKVVKRGESPIRLTYVDLGDKNGDKIGKTAYGRWLKEPKDGVFRSSGVPICNITSTPKIGVVNKIMRFEASISNNVTAIETYMWYIWEGTEIDPVNPPAPMFNTTTTTPVFEYDFNETGEYTVGLKVVDEDGVESALRLQEFKVVDSRDLEAVSIEIEQAAVLPNQNVTINAKVANLGTWEKAFYETCTATIYYNTTAVDWDNPENTAWTKAAQKQAEIKSGEAPTQITFTFNSSNFPTPEKNYYFLLNVTGIEPGYESNITNNIKISEDPVMYTLGRHGASIVSFALGYPQGPVLKHPVIKGEPVKCRAEIKNVGTYEDTFNATLYINNTIVANASFSLLPSETEAVEWTTELDIPLLRQSGLFNATLKVSLVNVAEANITTKTTWLRIIEPPVLNITISPETPVVNQTVTINASQSYHQDPNGTITSYRWIIYDPYNDLKFLGEGPDLTTINFKFTIEGNWTIELIVTDNFGLTYDANRERTKPYRTELTIAVVTAITHAPTISDLNVGYNLTGVILSPVIEGENVTIRAIIKNNGNVKEAFNVTLYINGIIIDIKETSELPPGSLESIIWKQPLLAGYYNVTVEAKIGDVKNNKTKWLRVIKPPNLIIDWTPKTPEVNQTVTLNASASTHQDPNGTITSWTWKIYAPDLDPNSATPTRTLTGPIVTLNFTQAGNWTIILEVQDNYGLTYNIERPATVSYKSQAEIQVIPEFVSNSILWLLIFFTTLTYILTKQKISKK